MIPQVKRLHSVSPKCQSAQGHSNKTKQDFRLTGFPKVSSRVSDGTAGNKRWGSPCYMPPFRLALSMGRDA